MTRSHVALGAAHLIGNALLLWLGYAWLGMSESDRPQLAASAAVLLAFGLGALWLHATALALFAQESTPSFRAAAATALRRLPWLFALAVIVTLVYALLSYCYDAFDHSAFVIGSALTMKLRKPAPPARVLACFHAFIWLLRWIVVPALALPLAARLVSKTSPRISRRWLYGLAAGGLLLAAVWVPLRLLDWIPKANGFGAEAVSFAARIGVGYLLFVAGLLALEFFTSSGKPRASQPNTAVSP
jgi:hypothetical protein